MALGSISNVFPNGRPSGLPVNIVDQIVEAKSQATLGPIESEIKLAELRKDAYTGLNSTLAQLYQAAKNLDTSSEFLTKNAGSTDTDITEAAVTNNAESGTYDISITSLARAHQMLVGVDDAEAGVNTGLGDTGDSDLIADGATVSFYHDGSSYAYTTDSDTTLASLATQINTADNGVSAYTTNLGTADDPQYVLSLKSQDTGGTTKQITTDADGTTTGVTLSESLFAGEVSEQETSQTGADADFSVDGVNYTRTTNTVNDIIPGVAFSLKNAGDAQINVARSTSAITAKVQSLVSAFNATEKYYDTKAIYNPTTEKAGILFGDSTARSAERAVDNVLRTNAPASNTYQYLAEVGLEINRDGDLEFDEIKFQQALENDPEAVATLFTGEDGVAGKLVNTLDQYTDKNDGIIASVIDKMDRDIKGLNEDHQDEQADLENYRDRLSAQYTTMEQAILKYQSMEDSLNSILDSWNSDDD